MINVILCGGSGTRLWPVSREEFPKQFYKFFDGMSLFQQTIVRNADTCNAAIVVTNSAHSEICLLQEKEIEKDTAITPLYLIEPVGRNTAPAIALAALSVSPDEILLICPSDHAIGDIRSYKDAIKRAQILAIQGHIVTFGIVPTAPESGYGYIEADGENVLSFKEKPDKNLAESYVADGKHYWNSGIFCIKAGVFLEELKKFEPKIYELSNKAYKESQKTDRFIHINHEAMTAIPSKSVDYAVLEKSDLVKVVKCDCGWSDLGYFDALYEYFDKDSQGNVHNPYAVYIDSENNYSLSSSEKPVVMVGVEDLIIVDTPDALLIAKRGKGQDVRKAFEAIKKRSEQNRKE